MRKYSESDVFSGEVNLKTGLFFFHFGQHSHILINQQKRIALTQ